MDEILVKWYDKQHKTFRSLEWDRAVDGAVPACYDCEYRKNNGGSWCVFKVGAVKAFNVITGEWDAVDDTNRCQDERYSTHHDDCGMKGKNFKQKKTG